MAKKTNKGLQHPKAVAARKPTAASKKKTSKKLPAFLQKKGK